MCENYLVKGCLLYDPQGIKVGGQLSTLTFSSESDSISHQLMVHHSYYQYQLADSEASPDEPYQNHESVSFGPDYLEWVRNGDVHLLCRITEKNQLLCKGFLISGKSKISFVGYETFSRL